MMRFTYEIFDADPTNSGPCGWGKQEAEGRTPEAVLRRVLRAAREQARGCEDCVKGDMLWAIVWSDGPNVEGTITLNRGFKARV